MILCSVCLTDTNFVNYNLIFLYIYFLCLVNIQLSINRSRHNLYIYYSYLLNSAVVYIMWLNFRYGRAKKAFQFETALKLFYAELLHSLKIVKFYPSWSSSYSLSHSQNLDRKFNHKLIYMWYSHAIYCIWRNVMVTQSQECCCKKMWKPKWWPRNCSDGGKYYNKNDISKFMLLSPHFTRIWHQIHLNCAHMPCFRRPSHILLLAYHHPLGCHLNLISHIFYNSMLMSRHTLLYSWAVLDYRLHFVLLLRAMRLAGHLHLMLVVIYSSSVESFECIMF